MQTLTTTEVAALRACHAETMLDTCQIGTPTETQSGAYTAETWSWASAIACGWKAGSGREASGDAGQAPMNDASVRLPIGTTVPAVCRVRLASRFGTSISPAEEYTVIGGPQVGPTAITLRLQRVTPGGVG